jgi:predicted Zn finger-like uncharacterized protein
MAELFASASSEGGVTRCPSCRTAFRVHAEQLAQHGGMVRCGKCDHVFNARDHLIVAPAAQPRGSSVELAAAAMPAHPNLQEPPAAATVPIGPSLDAEVRPHAVPEPGPSPTVPQSDAIPAEPGPARTVPAWPFAAPVPPAGYARNPTSHTEARGQPRAMAMPAGEAPADPVAASPDDMQPAHDDAFPPLRHEPLDTPDASPAPLQQPQPSDALQRNVPLPLIEAMGTAQASIRADDHVHAGASLDELDFGPRRKPARTGAAWMLAGLLLACALVLQVVYQYRGDIAILVPEARPMLADACAALGCDLPLPRLEKLVSIEDSDLQADTTNPTVMVLSAVLRNRAPFAQSYPAIELSLTDDRNETVARRVLGPEEYLARAPARDPKEGFAATTELPLKVFIDAGAVKATGYRLYLFYP